MMFQSKLRMIAMAIMCLVAVPAMAEETVFSVTETASKAVKKDRMAIVLRAEKVDHTALDAQNGMNDVMNKALDIVRAANTDDRFAFQTIGYSVYQRRNTESDDWTAQQGLQVSGTDFEALLKMATDLQRNGMLMNTIGYSVSPAIVRQVKESLVEEALQRLRDHSNAVATGLGVTFSHIRTIREASNEPRGDFRESAPGMALASVAAAPVQGEGGEGNVSVTFTADAVFSCPCTK